MWRKFLAIYPSRKQKGVTYDDLHPPLGIEVIAAATKTLVEEVVIVDMRYERRPVSSFLPGVDVAGLSVQWSHQKDAALEIIRGLPPGILVILGGIHATQNAEEYFRASPRVDIIVRGDGEETIREILSGQPLSGIKGLSYRRNGAVVSNEARPLLPLGDIYPDRSLRRYAYQYQLPLNVNIGIDCVMSSRGCNYRCEFCTFKVEATGQRRSWSGRSAESVVAEIEQIRSDMVIFCDDNFCQDVQRIERICDLIIARGIRKLFGCELRIEIVRRPDVLRKMSRAGFWALSFGLESWQDKTLRRINKGFTVKDIREAFKVFRRFNFFSLGYFIIGYVGESRAEILEIAAFARSLGLDFIGVSCLRAFLHSRLRAEIEKTPGYHIGEGGVVYSDECSIETLKHLRRTVEKRFYSLSQVLRIAGKVIFSGVPKRPILKFMTALVLSEFAGRGRKLSIGRLA